MLFKNACKKLCSLLAILLLVLFLSADFYAAPGDLDPTFGNGGKVTTNFGAGESANAVAVQSDGKIVIAGTFAVLRYNPNGSLDTSFDGDGKVTTDFADRAEAVAIQPDGKIVVAGSGGYGFELARYNPDGSLDTTFGTGGNVSTRFGNAEDQADNAYDMALQPDGKIVVVGIATTENYNSAALARYNANGSLDTSFGANGTGLVILSFAGLYFFGPANAVAVQSDGKIVIGGGVAYYSSVLTKFFKVVRLNANGQFDPTFGTNGATETNISGSSRDKALDIALQADGKIVAVGVANEQQGDFAMVRYNGNGTLDSSFGSSGKVITEFGSSSSSANGVVIQTDGKIISAGYAGSDFALTRHNTNGSLDTSFGSGGKIITDFNGGSIDRAKAVALQPDGKIIAVGDNAGTQTFDFDFALARYLGDSVVARRTPFDFDGDAKADISVFRPSDSIWYLNRSTQGFSATQFGLSTDKITPADYDGDGKTDIAVYREGTWYWLNSSNNSFNAVPFGLSGDLPLPADFTGDGRAELTVYRSGVWYTLNLTNNQFQAVQFGISTDKPVVADYDGDGKTDYAVFRPSDGTWYLIRSQSGFAVVQFGVSTDKPVVGDYDGDGKADPAVYRDGDWYLLRSSQGFTSFQFGAATDLPAPADYDGDGKTDVAVYRDNTWYLQQSTQGFVGLQFGTTGDKPIPNAFVP